jgi:hypothetical protein
MVTVYCLQSNNAYQITQDLFDRLVKQKIVMEIKTANSYFPKPVFNKKDLSHVITKTNG